MATGYPPSFDAAAVKGASNRGMMGGKTAMFREVGYNLHGQNLIVRSDRQDRSDMRGCFDWWLVRCWRSDEQCLMLTKMKMKMIAELRIWFARSAEQ